MRHGTDGRLRILHYLSPTSHSGTLSNRYSDAIIIVLHRVLIIIIVILIIILRFLLHRFLMVTVLFAIPNELKICKVSSHGHCSADRTEQSLFCCEYVMEYKVMFVYLIQTITWLDMATIIIITAGVFIAIFMSFCKDNKDRAIYAMATATAIAAIMTFTMLGMVSINDMIGTAEGLFENGCYDLPHLEPVMALKDELEDVIWFDSLNGTVDICSLAILFYGLYVRNGGLVNDIDQEFFPSKAAYVVLYVMRMIVAYISYFKLELSAYQDFLKLQDTPPWSCYQIYGIPFPVT